ncbi:hypothetical protein EXIGLDRAFT_671924 [Exidia glandulosa HHB12029]|uniref:Rhodopsin domain-containing protein n=1 Tax=Exidia glandulosa HHB12029 TaxID=1314781 RepID=A0A165K1K9_EXIGL|nr:hypothetical protein EXIGLDRAFT_671924 [Exidia glandulosa HHB12029]
MLDLTNPLVQIKITSLVCSTVAIGMTFFRLYVRRGRYWYDDAWALFSLLALFVQIASVFMHVPNPAELSKVNRVAAYYILATSFYAVIWSARLSILFSVIRLEPNTSTRRRLYWAALALFLTVCFLISQLFWVCEPEKGWKDLPSPQCTLNKEVAICQLVTDILSDALLVIAPLRMIRHVANTSLRRRLMFIFSTSVVTTIVSLVHAVYILRTGGTKVLVAAIVEDTVSLMVANLPVAATAAMRAAGVKTGPETEDPPSLSTLRFGAKSGGAAKSQDGGGLTGRWSLWTGGGRSRVGKQSVGSTTLNGTSTFKADDDVRDDVGLERSERERTTAFRLNELRSTSTAEEDPEEWRGKSRVDVRIDVDVERMETARDVKAPPV